MTFTPLQVSVVIPIFQPTASLNELVAELNILAEPQETTTGKWFCVHEIILVWDHGAGDSIDLLESLTESSQIVRAVWLTRNYGQHAATIAGMSASTGDWIITMDEDLQHDPSSISDLIDSAYSSDSQLVYAKPRELKHHAWWRNATSRSSKKLLSWVSPGIDFEKFNSFRLVEGTVGRAAAAYAGSGVYLDVALSWVVNRAAACDVDMRQESRTKSGYSLRSLLSHFGRMAISAGTRPLALVSIFGIGFFFLGIVAAMAIVIRVLTGAEIGAQGWASTFTALLVIGGLILFALGIIAQYIRATVETSLGRPLYVATDKPRLPATRPDTDGN